MTRTRSRRTRSEVYCMTLRLLLNPMCKLFLGSQLRELQRRIAELNVEQDGQRIHQDFA